ncbi:MAG: DUF4271 domain-containing protein [Flavobacteriaceae bacterium]
MLVIHKLYNPTRYRSMVFFWARTSSYAELNRPFNKDRALSTIPFLFRALVFGFMTQLFFTRSLGVSLFDLSVLRWAAMFISFWAIKTLIEGGIVSLLNKQEGLLKIFYIRSIFKEKLAFFYACLLLLLLYFKLSPAAAYYFSISYMIGLVFVHLRFFKLYFRRNNIKQLYIILYICAFEIIPVWLLIRALKH